MTFQDFSKLQLISSENIWDRLSKSLHLLLTPPPPHPPLTPPLPHPPPPAPSPFPAHPQRKKGFSSLRAPPLSTASSSPSPPHPTEPVLCVLSEGQWAGRAKHKRLRRGDRQHSHSSGAQCSSTHRQHEAICNLLLSISLSTLF